MTYSKSIDLAALIVARRMFKAMRASKGDDNAAFSARSNPLFYPCVVAFTAVVFWIASPLASVMMQSSHRWLPSPLVAWGILIFCAYPLARFCTAVLALRSR